MPKTLGRFSTRRLKLPLVMTNIADIAIENVPFIVIYLSEMVIFHSYVGLPEGSHPLSKTVTKYPSTNRVQLHSSALLDHSCASKTGSTVQLSNARLWRTVLARSTAPDMEMRLDLVKNQSPGRTKSTYT